MKKLVVSEVHLIIKGSYLVQIGSFFFGQSERVYIKALILTERFTNACCMSSIRTIALLLNHVALSNRRS